MSEFDTRVGEILTSLGSLLDRIAQVDAGVEQVNQEFQKMSERAKSVADAATAVNQLSEALKRINSTFVSKLNERIADVADSLRKIDPDRLDRMTESYERLGKVMGKIDAMNRDIANSVEAADRSFVEIKNSVSGMFQELGQAETKVGNLAKSLESLVKSAKDMGQVNSALAEFNNQLDRIKPAEYREIADSLTVLRGALRDFENLKLAVDISSLTNATPQIKNHVQDMTRQIRDSISKIDITPSTPSAPAVNTDVRTGARSRKKVQDITGESTNQTRKVRQTIDDDLAAARAEERLENSAITRKRNRYIKQGLDAEQALDLARREVVAQRDKPKPPPPAPKPATPPPPATTAPGSTVTPKVNAEINSSLTEVMRLRLLVNQLYAERQNFAEKRLESTSIPADKRREYAEIAGRVRDPLQVPEIQKAIQTEAFGKELERALKQFRLDIRDETLNKAKATIADKEGERQPLDLHPDTIDNLRKRANSLREQALKLGASEERVGAQFALSTQQSLQSAVVRAADAIKTQLFHGTARDWTGDKFDTRRLNSGSGSSGGAGLWYTSDFDDATAFAGGNDPRRTYGVKLPDDMKMLEMDHPAVKQRIESLLGKFPGTDYDTIVADLVREAGAQAQLWREGNQVLGVVVDGLSRVKIDKNAGLVEQQRIDAQRAEDDRRKEQWRKTPEYETAVNAEIDNYVGYLDDVNAKGASLNQAQDEIRKAKDRIFDAMEAYIERLSRMSVEEMEQEFLRIGSVGLDSTSMRAFSKMLTSKQAGKEFNIGDAGAFSQSIQNRAVDAYAGYPNTPGSKGIMGIIGRIGAFEDVESIYNRQREINDYKEPRYKPLNRDVYEDLVAQGHVSANFAQSINMGAGAQKGAQKEERGIDRIRAILDDLSDRYYRPFNYGMSQTGAIFNGFREILKAGSNADKTGVPAAVLDAIGGAVKVVGSARNLDQYFGLNILPKTISNMFSQSRVQIMKDLFETGVSMYTGNQSNRQIAQEHITNAQNISQKEILSNLKQAGITDPDVLDIVTQGMDRNSRLIWERLGYDSNIREKTDPNKSAGKRASTRDPDLTIKTVGDNGEQDQKRAAEQAEREKRARSRAKAKQTVQEQEAAVPDNIRAMAEEWQKMPLTVQREYNRLKKQIESGGAIKIPITLVEGTTDFTEATKRRIERMKRYAAEMGKELLIPPVVDPNLDTLKAQSVNKPDTRAQMAYIGDPNDQFAKTLFNSQLDRMGMVGTLAGGVKNAERSRQLSSLFQKFTQGTDLGTAQDAGMWLGDERAVLDMIKTYVPGFKGGAPLGVNVSQQTKLGTSQFIALLKQHVVPVAEIAVHEKAHSLFNDLNDRNPDVYNKPIFRHVAQDRKSELLKYEVEREAVRREASGKGGYAGIIGNSPLDKDSLNYFFEPSEMYAHVTQAIVSGNKELEAVLRQLYGDRLFEGIVAQMRKLAPQTFGESALAKLRAGFDKFSREADRLVEGSIVDDTPRATVDTNRRKKLALPSWDQIKQVGTELGAGTLSNLTTNKPGMVFAGITGLMRGMQTGSVLEGLKTAVMSHLASSVLNSAIQWLTINTTWLSALGIDGVMSSSATAMPNADSRIQMAMGSYAERRDAARERLRKQMTDQFSSSIGEDSKLLSEQVTNRFNDFAKGTGLGSQADIGIFLVNDRELDDTLYNVLGKRSYDEAKRQTGGKLPLGANLSAWEDGSMSQGIVLNKYKREASLGEVAVHERTHSLFNELAVDNPYVYDRPAFQEDMNRRRRELQHPAEQIRLYENSLKYKDEMAGGISASPLNNPWGAQNYFLSEPEGYAYVAQAVVSGNKELEASLRDLYGDKLFDGILEEMQRLAPDTFGKEALARMQSDYKRMETELERLAPMDAIRGELEAAKKQANKQPLLKRMGDSAKNTLRIFWQELGNMFSLENVIIPGVLGMYTASITRDPMMGLVAGGAAALTGAVLRTVGRSLFGSAQEYQHLRPTGGPTETRAMFAQATAGVQSALGNESSVSEWRKSAAQFMMRIEGVIDTTWLKITRIFESTFDNVVGHLAKSKSPLGQMAAKGLTFGREILKDTQIDQIPQLLKDELMGQLKELRYTVGGYRPSTNPYDATKIAEDGTKYTHWRGRKIDLAETFGTRVQMALGSVGGAGGAGSALSGILGNISGDVTQLFGRIRAMAGNVDTGRFASTFGKGVWGGPAGDVFASTDFGAIFKSLQGGNVGNAAEKIARMFGAMVAASASDKLGKLFLDPTDVDDQTVPVIINAILKSIPNRLSQSLSGSASGAFGGAVGDIINNRTTTGGFGQQAIRAGLSGLGRLYGAEGDDDRTRLASMIGSLVRGPSDMTGAIFDQAQLFTRQRLGENINRDSFNVQQTYDYNEGVMKVSGSAQTAAGTLVNFTGKIDDFGRVLLDKPSKLQKFQHEIRWLVMQIPEQILQDMTYQLSMVLQSIVTSVINVQDELGEIANLVGAMKPEDKLREKMKFFFKSTDMALATGNTAEEALQTNILSYKLMAPLGTDVANREKYGGLLSSTILGTQTAFGLDMATSLETIPAIFTQIRDSIPDFLNGESITPIQKTAMAISEMNVLMDKLTIAQRESGASAGDLIQVYAMLGQSAKDAGMSQDQLISLAAAASVKLNKSAQETATSLKSVMERAYQDGADDLARMGISTMQVNDSGEIEYRPFLEIIKEANQRIATGQVREKAVDIALGSRQRINEAKAIRGSVADQERIDLALKSPEEGGKLSDQAFESMLGAKIETIKTAANRMQAAFGSAFYSLVYGSGAMDDLANALDRTAGVFQNVASGAADSTDSVRQFKELVYGVIRGLIAFGVGGISLFGGVMKGINGLFTGLRAGLLAVQEGGQAVVRPFVGAVSLINKMFTSLPENAGPNIDRVRNFFVMAAKEAATAWGAVGPVIEEAARVNPALKPLVAGGNAAFGVTGGYAPGTAPMNDKLRQRLSKMSDVGGALAIPVVLDLMTGQGAESQFEVAGASIAGGIAGMLTGPMGGMVGYTLAKYFMDSLDLYGMLPGQTSEREEQSALDAYARLAPEQQRAFLDELSGYNPGQLAGLNALSTVNPLGLSSAPEAAQVEQLLDVARNDPAIKNLISEMRAIYGSGGFAERQQMTAALNERVRGNALFSDDKFGIASDTRYNAGIGPDGKPIRLNITGSALASYFDQQDKLSSMELSPALMKFANQTGVSNLDELRSLIIKAQTPGTEEARQLSDVQKQVDLMKSYEDQESAANEGARSLESISETFKRIDDKLSARERSMRGEFDTVPGLEATLPVAGSALNTLDEKYRSMLERYSNGEVDSDTFKSYEAEYQKRREGLLSSPDIIQKLNMLDDTTILDTETGSYRDIVRQDMGGLNGRIVNMDPDAQRGLMQDLNPFFSAREVVMQQQARIQKFEEYGNQDIFNKDEFGNYINASANSQVAEEFKQRKAVLDTLSEEIKLNDKKYAQALAILALLGDEAGLVKRVAAAREAETKARRRAETRGYGGSAAQFTPASIFSTEGMSAADLQGGINYALEKQGRLAAMNPEYAKTFSRSQFLLENPSTGQMRGVRGVDQSFVQEYLAKQQQRRQLPSMVDFRDYSEEKQQNILSRAKALQDAAFKLAPDMAQGIDSERMLIMRKNNDVMMQLGLKQEFLQAAIEELNDTTEETLRGHYNLPAEYRMPTVWDYYDQGGKEAGDVNFKKPGTAEGTTALAASIAAAMLNPTGGDSGVDLGTLTGLEQPGAAPLFYPNPGTAGVSVDIENEIPDYFDVDTVNLTWKNAPDGSSIDDKARSTGYYYTSMYANQFEGEGIANKARETGYYYSSMYANTMPSATGAESSFKNGQYQGYYTTANANGFVAPVAAPATDATTLATLPKYNPNGVLDSLKVGATSSAGGGRSGGTFAEIGQNAEKAKTGLSNTSSALNIFARTLSTANPVAGAVVTALLNMDKFSAALGKAASILGGVRPGSTGQPAVGSQNLYIYVNGTQVQVTQQPVQGNGGQALVGTRPTVGGNRRVAQ